MNRKKKGKYIGLAGALLVHVVVIALLILVGFTLPEQSEEGGVPVMMGETPDAWGAADPSLVEVETMPEEAAPEMPEEAEQEMAEDAFVSGIRANLDVNILPYVEAHPETEFVFWYPPYSILYWNDVMRQKELDAVIRLSLIHI